MDDNDTMTYPSPLGLRDGEWIKYVKSASPYSIPAELKNMREITKNASKAYEEDTIVMNDTVFYSIEYRVSQEPVDGGDGYFLMHRKKHGKETGAYRRVRGNFYKIFVGKNNDLYFTGDSHIEVSNKEIAPEGAEGLFIVKLNLTP